jgi:G3E family GTPase
MTEPEPELSAVEVIILTGLPGAGRTTLLGSLLADLCQPAGGDDPKVAVCVHRFAKAFGLETSRIDQFGAVVHYSEVYDFGSGCICCSPDGDLVRVLHELDSATAERRPTHLLLETTGLADPQPFIQVFARPQFSNLFRLRGVVAVVSALHCHRLSCQGSLDSGGAALEQRHALQLQAADIVLLTKTAMLPRDHDTTASVRAALSGLVAEHCASTVKLQLEPLFGGGGSSSSNEGDGTTPDVHKASAKAHTVESESGTLRGDTSSWRRLQSLLPSESSAALAVASVALACAAPSPPLISWGAGGHDSR